MKFKISEIAKLTGFSSSGIRFFEEAGVLSPTRGANEKYREYSLDDLQRIMVCKHYRDCGFSLQESVDLLQHGEIPIILNHLEKQSKCIGQQIAEKQTLLEFLEQKEADLQVHLTGESLCQILQMPELIWKKLWQPGDREKREVPSRIVKTWFLHSPIMDSCLLLSEEDFLKGEGNLRTDWGVSIEKRCAEKINFNPSEEFKVIPSARCVRVVINPNEDLTISANQLKNVRDYLRIHRLAIAGLAVSRIFYSVISNGKLIRYDHLWIPIQSG